MDMQLHKIIRNKRLLLLLLLLKENDDEYSLNSTRVRLFRTLRRGIQHKTK